MFPATNIHKNMLYFRGFIVNMRFREAENIVTLSSLSLPVVFSLFRFLRKSWHSISFLLV